MQNVLVYVKRGGALTKLAELKKVGLELHFTAGPIAAGRASPEVIATLQALPFVKSVEPSDHSWPG